MARFVVYLREQERNALYRLAEQESRAPKVQAALIIRTELQRLGFLASMCSVENTIINTHAQPDMQEQPNDIIA